MPTPLKLLPLLRGSPFAFPLAALAALAMFLISESSYQQAITTFDRLGQRGEARGTIQSLWRSLTDTETAQRGYLLTGRPEYLRPLDIGRQTADRALAWLHNYYNDPETDTLMEQVTKAASAKVSELTATIRLRDEGKDEAWRALVLSNIGSEKMDEVRFISQKLLDIETARVAVDRKSLGQTLLLNRIGVTAMTALSLLALYMYLRQTTALVRQREEQRRLTQIERDQFAREVMLRTEQLTDLTQHLQTVREDERHRLARELHDELGALLTAAKLDVARLKSRLGGEVTPEIADRLQHLSDGLNSGIALKRRIIEDLRPSSLSNLGLVSALEILVREWAQRNEIEVDAEFERVQLRAAGELTVYRLVQEALTNIAKYARASEVQVRVASQDGRVRVTVRDNGAGFDLDAPRVSAHGLLGMRYRLEAEGGQLVMESAPGKGTLIRADLPESHEPPRTTGYGDLG
jgi:signal transduction histidine kinase